MTGTFEIPYEFGEDYQYLEVDIKVDYEICGRYFPATRDEPAEYPEVYVEFKTIVDPPSMSDVDELLNLVQLDQNFIDFCSEKAEEIATNEKEEWRY